MTRLRLFYLLMCIGMLMSVFPVYAQDEALTQITDDQVNTIAQKLYCPVCENITLDTCGTAACADWRYEIRLQLEAGRTEEEIMQDFVTRFGDRVVGTPMDPTLRALSLVTPWLVIAGALIGITYVFARQRRSSPAAANAAASSSAPKDRYLDLLEQDLSGE